MDMIQNKSFLFNQDCEYIAAHFNISISETVQLIELLKSFFDIQGNFQKSVFEKRLEENINFDSHVFEFLWYFLKEFVLDRNDRIALLNSLKKLVEKVKIPEQSIKILMTDFLKDPDTVNYSDRNALILANILIRKYNKESNLHIEMTPEEVLLIKDGLNKELTLAISKVVDSVYYERIFKKIKTIHQTLILSLNARGKKTEIMPIRFLLSLEREIFIFLCLIEGLTARAVIKAALNQYGNPRSDVYHLQMSKIYLIPLLQHLKVIIRGMGRIGVNQDLELLTNTAWNEKLFDSLSENIAYKRKVKQVITWIDAAKEEIIRKELKDSIDTGTFQVHP